MIPLWSRRIARKGLLLGFLLAGCAGNADRYDRALVSAGVEQRTGRGIGPGDGSLPPGLSLEDGLSEDEAVTLALWNNAPFQEALADLGLKRETGEFFAGFEQRISIGDVCFVHDEMELPRHNPTARFFNRDIPRNGSGYRILFVGHTHHRAALSDNGPLDLAHNIVLDPNRRYVINPGPLVNGQFAIWDRAESVVRFKQVK